MAPQLPTEHGAMAFSARPSTSGVHPLSSCFAFFFKSKTNGFDLIVCVFTNAMVAMAIVIFLFDAVHPIANKVGLGHDYRAS